MRQGDRAGGTEGESEKRQGRKEERKKGERPQQLIHATDLASSV